ENEIWLSDLTIDLMKEGSQTMTSKEISNKMAGMGGNLDMTVLSHTTTLSTSVLSDFSDDAIALMADVLLRPKWPSNELPRLKNDRKRYLEISLSQPQSQASKDFYATIYPDHPYGRIYPNAEQIDRYSIENIKNFYDTNFGAQRTTIYVVGKFNKDKVIKAVRAGFNDWIKGPEVSYPIATAVTEGKVKIIDRPGAPQSTIMYGLPVIDPSNPDYTALEVMNSILGGSFGSRITSNIREDKGYTYSPYSNIDTNYKSGVWYESADVTTEFTGASLNEINKEIYRLQNEPPTIEELDGIKNYESGIFVLQNSTPNGIIGQLNFLDVHNLDDDYLKNRVMNILAVTPEQVQEMAKKYIIPKNMTLIVVGDKEKIEKQMNETINQKDKLKQ
ncbi:MAG TPA: pitrilysin family protein, partial [Aquaticitalea sp.]|nr:pitrilysin family protein [Aquaticitalea sp.]